MPDDAPQPDQPSDPPKVTWKLRNVTGTPAARDFQIIPCDLPEPGEDPEWEAMMREMDPDFPD